MKQSTIPRVSYDLMLTLEVFTVRSSATQFKEATLRRPMQDVPYSRPTNSHRKPKPFKTQPKYSKNALYSMPSTTTLAFILVPITYV